MPILGLQRADPSEAVLAGHETRIEYFLSELAEEYDLPAT